MVLKFPERLNLFPKNRDFYIWCCVFLMAAIFYSCTAQSCISWQDSGMFQWRVLNGDTLGRFGLALAHPFYIVLAGWFESLPFGGSAFKINIFSAVGMAVALANTVFLVCELTGKIWAGIASALIFMVMHTPWWLATIAEVYTWDLAFFSLELILLVKLLRCPENSMALLLAIVSGLDLAVHNMALLALPVYFGAVIYLVIRRRLNVWVIPGVLCMFFMGSLTYLYNLYCFAVQEQSLIAAARSALFGSYAEQVFNTDATWRFNTVNAGLISLNFINLVIPFALVGIYSLKRELGRLLTGCLCLIAVLELVFVLRFPVPDQFTFMLPSLLLIVSAAGIGINVIYKRFSRLRRLLIIAVVLSIIVPPICYAISPALIRNAGIVLNREHNRPFRDEIRYWAVPWKQNESSAERFAAAALEEAEPNGLIISDSTSYYPLMLFQKLNQQFPKVMIRLSLDLKSKSGIASEYINRIKANTVYSVLPQSSLFPEGVQDKITFKRDDGAVLFRVIWKSDVK